MAVISLLQRSVLTRHLAVKSLTARFSTSLYNFKDLPTSNPLNLPRLPVPSLEDTKKNWLISVEPVLSPEEMSRARKLADDFFQNQAPALHKKVVELSNSKGYPFSYIEKFWDDMYLGPNDPVPIWCNPVFLQTPWPTVKATQAGIAARYAVSQMKFLKNLKEGQVQVKDQCMKAFYAMYGTTRLPQPAPKRDILSTTPDSKHVVVMRANKMWTVDLLGDDGSCVSVAELEKEFQRIIDSTPPAAPNQPQLSMMTAADRAFWSTHYNALVADPSCAKSMKRVETGLFAICLDANPVGNMTKASEAFLHNWGYDRWFDKSLSWIVTPDLYTAVNFEHSWGDGMLWNRMLSEVWYDAQGQVAPGYKPLPTLKERPIKKAEPIEWNLPASVQAGVKEAAKSFKEFCDDTHTKVLDFSQFGSDKIKTWKVSPDAVVQMSFQMAQYRLHKNFVSTYESCSTGKFLHGRTETIRSCTNEARAFVLSMADAKTTSATKKELFSKAAAQHIQIAKACANGLGVDRHLRAMKEIAAVEGNLPAFYKDPIYPLTSTWRLSTSNVSATHNRLFAFGPVCGDGYGLGYVIRPDLIPVNITCFRSDPTKTHNSDKMAESISDCLVDIGKLFN